MESTNPYASSGSDSPTPPQRGWWARNWKWFVPVLVIVLVLIPCCSCVGLMWYAAGQWQMLEPVPQAMQVIRQSPEVVAALGTPIETGTFPSDLQMNYNNSTGDAQAAFDVSGPNDQATVTLDATYDGTQWTFDELTVTVDSTGEQIDLSGATVPSGPGQPAPVPAP